MEKLHVAGLALDQGADPGAMVRPNDEIPLPVAGLRAVIGIEAPVVDADHGGGEPAPRSDVAGVAAAVVSPGPQRGESSGRRSRSEPGR